MRQGYETLRQLCFAHCQPPARRAEYADPEAERMVRVGFPELVEEREGICSCHRVLSPRAFVCPLCGTRTCEIPSVCAVCAIQLVSAPALARSYHHLFPVPRFVAVPSASAPGVGPAAAPAAGEAAGARAAPPAGGVALAPAIAASSPSSSSSAAAPLSSPQPPRQLQDQPPRLLWDASAHCRACLDALGPDEPRLVCPQCGIAVCGACDELIHDTIHSCPGCAR